MTQREYLKGKIDAIRQRIARDESEVIRLKVEYENTPYDEKAHPDEKFIMHLRSEGKL